MCVCVHFIAFKVLFNLIARKATGLCTRALIQSNVNDPTGSISTAACYSLTASSIGAHCVTGNCTVSGCSSAMYALQATGKNFIMDSKFNLGNLLELGLHNYVDACSEIVDRAQKELIIEKALKKIDETWSSLNLTFSPYQDTDNVQMTVEDSITEALETDNLALQTMSGGKYVQVISCHKAYNPANSLLRS